MMVCVYSAARRSPFRFVAVSFVGSRLGYGSNDDRDDAQSPGNPRLDRAHGTRAGRQPGAATAGGAGSTSTSTAAQPRGGPVRPRVLGAGVVRLRGTRRHVVCK